MNTARAWILAVLAVSVLGCGQKGPLVLPDAQHAHKKVKLPSTKGPQAPAAPAEHTTAPSAPAGPATQAAPPEAVPESSSPPNPAPQD